MRRSRLLFIFVGFLCVSTGMRGQMPAGNGMAYLPGRVVVKFKAATAARMRGAAAADLQQQAARLNAVRGSGSASRTPVLRPMFPAQPARRLAPAGAAARGQTTVRLPEQLYELRYETAEAPETVAARLAAQSDVEYAEPLYVHVLLGSTTTPNDSLLPQQWAIHKMQLPQAWNITQGDTSIVIAVIDDAVQYTHADLWPNLHRNWADPPNGRDDDGDGYVDNHIGWDFAAGSDRNPGQDNDPREAGGLGHGTNMTGYAAAATNNRLGVAGTAWRCRFMPIKTAADTRTYGTYLLYGYQAIMYAADAGAQVINCSWGSTYYSRFGQDAVNYATARGAVVVASAGNQNDPTPYYPASFENVLSVAATDANDRLWAPSSYGAFVDVCAPGGSLTTMAWNVPPPRYLSFNQGFTSPAAPKVAGVAALVCARFPHYTPQQVAEQIRVTADPIDSLNPLRAGLLGSGRVNAFRAVSEMRPAVRRTAVLVDAGADSLAGPGDTLHIRLRLRNWLAATADLRVSLASADTFALVLADTLRMGSLPTLGDTLTPVVRVYLKPGIPTDRALLLRIQYRDGSYVDSEPLLLDVHRTWADVSAGGLHSTLTANGRLGFADFPIHRLGQGVRMGRQNGLFDGGIVLATSSTRVVDNVRLQSGIPSTRLAASGPVRAAPDGRRVDADLTDAGAGAVQLGLAVRLTAQAVPAAVSYPQAILLRMQVRNRSGAAFNGLHAGWMLDWDVGEPSWLDTARFDQMRRLAWVGGHRGSVSKPPYFGLLALSRRDSARSFAGLPSAATFSDAGKFAALTAPATSEVLGNDVVQTLAFGALQVAAGDSVVLDAVVLAAPTKQGLFNLADSLLAWNACRTEVLHRPPQMLTACDYPTLRMPSRAGWATIWTDSTCGSLHSGDSLVATHPGTYRAVSRTQFGCTDTLVFHVQPGAGAVLQASISDSVVAAAGPLRLHDSTAGATGHRWELAGQTYLAADTVVTAPAPGTYTVRLVATQGLCAGERTWPLTVLPASDAADSGQLLVYPNPNAGTAYLRRSGMEAGLWQLQLLNSLGQVVWQVDTDSRAWAGDLPLPLPAAAGLYLLQARHTRNGRTLRAKILRQ